VIEFPPIPMARLGCDSPEIAAAVREAFRVHKLYERLMTIPDHEEDDEEET
jgi:hypothetical protein